MTICGQLLDLETSLPLVTNNPQGNCDPQHPAATGPCALEAHVFDAIAFASDPQTATDLAADEVLVNECGQVRITNLVPAGAQYVAVALRNATGVTTHRVTGLAMPVATGKAIKGVPLFALRTTTDQAWTTSAGLTGATFADRGVYVGIFLHGQAPVPGVKLTRTGTISADDDYYFSDTSPTTRSTIEAAQAQTGANGTALMLGASGNLTQYSGTGAEATSCKWPSDLGDQIAGTAFVQPRLEVLTANPTAICP